MKVIAHRGASGYAPENTMASFELAVEMGAKAIEFDVQMTKDGEIIVFHDYTLGRTAMGEGMIMNKTLAELETLDAGIWFSNKFKNEKIPTLKEVLKKMPKEIELHIEIKKVVLDNRNIEEEVYSIVLNENRLKNSIFSSFDHECIKRLSMKYDVNIGVLVSSNILNPIKYLKDNQLDKYSFNQNLAFVSERVISDMHKENLKVLIYTVNDKEEALLLKKYGVDEIFSNYPDII